MSATAPETSHFPAGDPSADWPQGIMSCMLWRLSLVDQNGHLFGRCAQVAAVGVTYGLAAGRRAGLGQQKFLFQGFLLSTIDTNYPPQRMRL